MRTSSGARSSATSLSVNSEVFKSLRILLES
nr:MAG TPA: hypothetical protein [Caudoviricetes sp.]